MAQTHKKQFTVLRSKTMENIEAAETPAFPSQRRNDLKTADPADSVTTM